MNKERGILFSAPMVNAILEGRKTQTRRMLKPQPPSIESIKAKCGQAFHLFTDESQPHTWRVAGACGLVRDACGQHSWDCPYGNTGDRIWVRETWKVASCYDSDCAPSEIPECEMRDGGVRYRADGDTDLSGKWRPSIFMPRAFSRITLKIESVCVERLQDISESDANAEGVEAAMEFPGNHTSYRTGYAILWADINGEGSWVKNPWVWVITFSKIPLATTGKA